MDPKWYAFPPFAQSSENALMAKGTTAIARCKPTNSVADLGTTLIELRREGLPALLGADLWKSRLKHLRETKKSAGGEYLNVEFGWKPLVSDILATAKGIVHMHRILEQYERDAGRVVRRRYSFPSIHTVEESVIQRNLTAGLNPSHEEFYDTTKWNSGYVVRDRETVVNCWFSGAFTYHLPKGFSSEGGLKGLADSARKMLGLDLDPEVLWNVAPWSWAVDWFSSSGDVISNVSDWSTDGLVLKYGYVMEHTIVRDTFTYVGHTGLVPEIGWRPPVLILVSETKVRRAATPFGFGVNLAALTDRQTAIIAALGLSR